MSTEHQPVPIVGQVFIVRKVVPMTLITCNCEAQMPILIEGFKSSAQCPACKRIYRQVAALAKYDPVTNRADYNAAITVSMPEEQPAAPALVAH